MRNERPKQNTLALHSADELALGEDVLLEVISYLVQLQVVERLHELGPHDRLEEGQELVELFGFVGQAELFYAFECEGVDSVKDLVGLHAQVALGLVAQLFQVDGFAFQQTLSRLESRAMKERLEQQASRIF